MVVSERYERNAKVRFLDSDNCEPCSKEFYKTLDKLLKTDACAVMRCDIVKNMYAGGRLYKQFAKECEYPFLNKNYERQIKDHIQACTQCTDKLTEYHKEEVGINRLWTILEVISTNRANARFMEYSNSLTRVVHNSFENLMHKQIKGTLTPRVADAFHGHLLNCKDCLKKYEEHIYIRAAIYPSTPRGKRLIKRIEKAILEQGAKGTSSRK